MVTWSSPALHQWICNQWQINIHCVRTDIEIQGSPERSLSRVVIEDSQGRLFLVEQFDQKKWALRDRVARGVDFLFSRGLTQVLPYRKSVRGEFLPFFKGDCFQVSAFLDGTPLKRPDYLSSSAMGKNTARFLGRMAQSAAGMEPHISFPRFSIKNYIHDLFRTMKIHDRPVHDRFLPVLDFLESEFMPAHDRLPLSFCHGDLHPLNILWDKDEIQAVIDWEFAGVKPDLYDAANFVGCAGIENPNGLVMDMVMTFLSELHQTDVISDTGWRVFPEYVLALRFAWLSEWLRKKDQEMIDLEQAFMNILVDHMAEIKEAFDRVA
ncbi:MAG: phosphotransferase [Desulfotignum sp.]|nr:phosphotransferase [Desulfotignum sp.]